MTTCGEDDYTEQENIGNELEAVAQNEHDDHTSGTKF
jgi:hypothetical protein